jgi:ATP-binding cassette subfamily C protein CydD
MTIHSAPMLPADRKKLEGFLRGKASLARAPLMAAIASGAVGGVALIVQAWLLARVVDAVVIHGLGLEKVWSWLWFLLAVFNLRAIASAIGDAAAFEAGARVVLAVRADLVARIVALGPSWTRRQRTGEVTSTVFDAAESIGRYYAGYLPQRALVVFIPLAILAFVVPTDWVSAIILCVSAPLIPIFMVLIGRGTEALNQAQWRKLALLSAHVFDAIEGLTTLKLFNASRAEAAAVAQSAEAYRTSTMEVLRVAFLSSLALEFLATVSIAMVAVYIGFRLYYRELHFLPGFAVLLLAPEFYRPLRAMGTQYHARMEAIGAADAIVALLDTPVPFSPERSGRLVTTPIERIRFEQVGFSYDVAQAGSADLATPALERIDFTLARGQLLALVGPSGAGKTTVSQLLLGFLTPTRGRITVDGCDLTTLPAAAWRARIAWLPQRPTLFHGTLLDNIRLFCPHAGRARLREAIDQAEAARLIDRLPHGLETIIGERGQGLSGGEIQRIALARMFLKDADLVVLDEPGAALDSETAAVVARSIDALSKRCAMLVIAHRVETVRDAHEILVLHNGIIVGRGRHCDLARRDMTYASVMGLRASLDA